MTEVALAKRYGKILSASMPCPDLNFLTFLRHAQGQARFLWASPKNERVIAGFGSAVEISSWGERRIEDIEEQVKDLFSESKGQKNRAKLFGGFAFQDDFSPENAWTNFAPAQFILPHYQFDSSPEGSFLSVHVELQEDELSQADLEDVLQARYELIKQDRQVIDESNELLELADLSAFETWASMIAKAQGFMQKGDLSKVVFARMKEARFAKPVSPLKALTYLESSYPDCYRFLFEPIAGDAFVGATPELLVELKDNKASSMALAASAARGKTKAEDDALAEALMLDPKESREHSLVKEKVAERLAAFGKVQVSETTVLKLSNIQHLFTSIKVKLKGNESVLDLLKALHPTPALGGEPFELASELISDLEALPRGWYAAPIGFIDADLQGAFAVAIRSAVLQQDRAWLFAGAGIMPRSVAEKEWQETAMKFRPMLNALGITDV